MSNFFEWDPGKFALGVQEMDREHQTLIGYMNALHALYAAGAPRPAVAKALDDLAKYTIQHFADEEAYMQRTNFPDLQKHRGVHKTLLERVTGYIKEFQSTGQLTDGFFAFLKMWLRAHICGVDSKYAQRSAAA